MVPEVGIEPTRHFCPGVLSPMRLPSFAIRAICVSFQIQHKIIIHHITSYVKFYLQLFMWCPKPESNRHDRSRRILSPLRLPISPFGQRFVFHFKFNIRSLYITLRLVSNFYLHHFLCGLRERIRTFDPLIPNQVLCQTELLGEKIAGGMYWIRTNDFLLVREILYQLS